jgi:hypothetical protein
VRSSSARLRRGESGGEWREAAQAYQAWVRTLREAGRDEEADAVADELTYANVRRIGAGARRRR